MVSRIVVKPKGLPRYFLLNVQNLCETEATMVKLPTLDFRKMAASKQYLF